MSNDILPINTLPEEMILKIFSYLASKDLENVRLVNSLFNRLGGDNVLMKRLLAKYFPHYLPPLINDTTVNYKRVFYQAMYCDYQTEAGLFSEAEIKIFHAAKFGKLQAFKELAELYDTPDALEQLLAKLDNTNRNCIQWAGYFAHQEILDFLFEIISKFFMNGDTIDHNKEISGLKYIHFVAMCNQQEIITQATNEELNIATTSNANILTLVVGYCHVRLIQYLVETRHFDLSNTADNRKPFHYAAAHGNTETLKYVLSKCEITNADILTLYQASINCNNAVSMKFLLDNSYDVNVRESLIHRRGNVMIRSSIKDNTLSMAVHQRRPVLAIMLLKHPDCKPNNILDDHVYNNPYTYSAEMNLALAEQLFQSVKNQYLNENNEFDTSKIDAFGNTIFHWLTYCNQLEILCSLSQTLPNTPNKGRQSPIELAAICGYVEIIKFYHTNGIDINAQYYYGFTLLHIAVKYGHPALAEYLVSCAGIDVDLPNDHNSTPLRTACDEGHLEVVRILLNAGANVNIGNMHNVTPLVTAAEKGHVEILKELLERPEIDVNAKPWSDQSALDYAIENQHQDCVELLNPYYPNSNCVL